MVQANISYGHVKSPKHLSISPKNHSSLSLINEELDSENNFINGDLLSSDGENVYRVIKNN